MTPEEVMRRLLETETAGATNTGKLEELQKLINEENKRYDDIGTTSIGSRDAQVKLDNKT